MFYLLSSLMLLVSAICFYVVACKTEFHRNRAVHRLTKYPRAIRGLGLFLLMLGTWVLVHHTGLAKGIILAMIVWSVLAGWLLLLVPFLQNRIT